jgi:hypothetical protein
MIHSPEEWSRVVSRQLFPSTTLKVWTTASCASLSWSRQASHTLSRLANLDLKCGLVDSLRAILMLAWTVTIAGAICFIDSLVFISLSPLTAIKFFANFQIYRKSSTSVFFPGSSSSFSSSSKAGGSIVAVQLDTFRYFYVGCEEEIFQYIKQKLKDK